MESYGLTVGRPGRVTGARIETCHARHVVYYDQSRPGRVTGARIETPSGPLMGRTGDSRPGRVTGARIETLVTEPVAAEPERSPRSRDRGAD